MLAQMAWQNAMAPTQRPSYDPQESESEEQKFAEVPEQTPKGFPSPPSLPKNAPSPDPRDPTTLDHSSKVNVE